ncbi:MAG: cell division protein ZapE [Rhizobiaceae bacterium]
MNSVADALLHLVESGGVSHDPAQAAIAARLDRVLDEIAARRLASKTSALGWLFAKRVEKIEGLYIHGDVGRGKTMLMDLFFERVPVRRKRRIHFNDFMADVHDRIAAHRAAVKNGSARGDDPIPPVAAALAREAWVLCFDEFSVTDIADAMILSRLFTALFGAGVILVATSNVAPADLYRDGLNRALFLPFIDILKAHARIAALDAYKDYRLEQLNRMPVYLTPLGPAAEERMDAAWTTASAGRDEMAATIRIKGREIVVEHAAGTAARFSFDELCARPLGARDYLALADRFDTFLIDRIPVMDARMRNEAKRFILLVDTLYDKKRKLIVSAAAGPDTLYREKSGTEAFEFRRTASRLVEMQGADWAGGDASE